MTDEGDGTGEGLVAAAMDALPSQVAILDGDGEILYTNAAWEAFGRENGLGSPPDSVGENYLAVCDREDDENAAAAAAGIRSLLSGDRERFGLEYPCHSPEERRWFRMWAVRFERDGRRYALVQHVNVTERREAEEAVRGRNAQLEALTKVLSHDLRNPMAVALGRAEAIAADDGDDHADTVVSALERMDAIIDAALTLARGAAVEDPGPVDLATAAETAWSHVDTGAATLSVAGTSSFRADPDLLEQLLENLFRNAVEHAGPAVGVEVGSLPDGFYVADDGPGIPEADREAIFEAGFSTGEGGTGLGLAIVERIAESHDWQVVATGADGGGARFEVTGVEPTAE